MRHSTAWRQEVLPHGQILFSIQQSAFPTSLRVMGEVEAWLEQRSRATHGAVAEQYKSALLLPGCLPAVNRSERSRTIGWMFINASVLWQLVAQGNRCIKNPSDFAIRWCGRRAIIGVRYWLRG